MMPTTEFLGSTVASLAGILRYRAVHEGEKVAYTFLNETGEELAMTYKQLDAKASSIAESLLEQCNPGEAIMILQQPGLEYIASFMACLYGGFIAVPAYPPFSKSHGERVARILHDVNGSLALISTKDAEKLETILQDTPIRFLATDTILCEKNHSEDMITVPMDCTAFLQYTSGSTSAPKGVMVTHRNLISNLESIRTGFGHTANDIGLIWLPPYHDMGLIGGILQPLYVGFPLYFMSPSSFMQNPLKWIKSISKYKVTTSGGPNFAYSMCAKRIMTQPMDAVDLSSWRVAFIGAEPIQLGTLRSFQEAFIPYGFRGEAFYTCYGLAESTLMVSGGFLGKNASAQYFNREHLREGHAVQSSEEANGLAMVGCGISMEKQTLLIVHPDEHTLCEDGEIGEVWVNSESKAAGYYNQPENTRDTFHAQFSDAKGDFLRTGDLGFIQHKELFITSRTKDVLIIRGHNHYPADIEMDCVTVDKNLIPEGCSAFSIQEDGEERLILVQELHRHFKKERTEETVARIREIVAKNHGLSVWNLVFTSMGSIPRTSSGKIQRSKCKEMYLTGTLKSISRHAQQSRKEWDEALLSVPKLNAQLIQSLRTEDRRNCLESYTLSLLEAILSTNGSVQLHAPLLSLGLDSVMAAQLLHRIQTDLCIELPFNYLYSGLTVSGLITLLESGLDSQSISWSIERLNGNTFPLTPNQERLWLLEQIYPGTSAYHIPLLFKLQGDVDTEALLSACDYLIQEQDVLRTKIVEKAGRACQCVTDWHEELVHQIFKVISQPADSAMLENNLQDAIGNEMQRSFSLQHGPLVRITLMQTEPQQFLLLLVVHHILSDLKSVQMISTRLFEHYASFIRKESLPAPYQELRFFELATWSAQRLTEERMQIHSAYWKKALDQLPGPSLIPADFPRALPRSFQSSSVNFQISKDLQVSIMEFGRQHDASPYLICLSAFTALLHLSSSSRDLVIGTPFEGRLHPQSAGAIGFFAHPLPLRITLGSDAPTFADILSSVKEVMRNALAHQEISLSEIIAITNPLRTLHGNPLFQHMFTFYKFDCPYPELPSMDIIPMEISSSETEFDLQLTIIQKPDGQMSGTLTYPVNLFAPETVSGFCEGLLSILELAVTQPHCPLQGALPPASSQPEEIQLLVSSTFTCNIIEDSLAFWAGQIKPEFKIEFAPYNQMFQQLLDPESMISRNKNGFNIFLLRIQDFYSFDEEHTLTVEDSSRFIDNAMQFAVLLNDFCSRSTVPSILALCPDSPGKVSRNLSAFREIRAQLAERCSQIQGLYQVPEVWLTEGYFIPDDKLFDPYAESLTQIPYQADYFTVLGTAIARAVHMVVTPPRKVIVTDCDHTLWKGLCAEEGYESVELDEKSRFYQQFLLKQQEQGMLIALCSKNNEEDVWNVFQHRKDMLLKKEDVIAQQINWSRKSENLYRIAEELKLGLDSFIFIDDSPLECEDVKSHCPGVTVIPLSEQLEEASAQLARVWAFDKPAVTKEDTQRHRLYAENKQRESFLQEYIQCKPTSAYQQFLEQLQLVVSYTPLEESNLARASQMTFRTNQFNFTSLRRTENELRQVLLEEGMQGQVIQVSDRFGQYGSVGLLLYRIKGLEVWVDSFMLSCRVLGRGVEYQIINDLGHIMEQEYLSDIIIPFNHTERNTPAWHFLSQIAVNPFQPDEGGRYLFRFQKDHLLHLSGIPALETEAAQEEAKTSDKPLKHLKSSTALHDNLLSYSQVDHMLQAIRSRNNLTPTDNGEMEKVHPRNAFEKQIAQIWSELLNIYDIGVYDNFFSLGGHSLLAYQVLFRIKAAFHVELPVQVLYTTDFTIAEIAAAVENQILLNSEEEEMNQLLQEIEQMSEEDIMTLLAITE